MGVALTVHSKALRPWAPKPLGGSEFSLTKYGRIVNKWERNEVGQRDDGHEDGQEDALYLIQVHDDGLDVRC